MDLWLSRSFVLFPASPFVTSCHTECHRSEFWWNDILEFHLPTDPFNVFPDYPPPPQPFPQLRMLRVHSTPVDILEEIGHYLWNRYLSRFVSCGTKITMSSFPCDQRPTNLLSSLVHIPTLVLVYPDCIWILDIECLIRLVSRSLC